MHNRTGLTCAFPGHIPLAYLTCLDFLSQS
jgi:hypothetical protein